MNLLDTFAFLFTTNAKQAQKDVEGFGKATQQTQDDINRADKSASNLGVSFSKLALAGVAALESFSALGKLKDGITNAINYNAEIEKTAKLTNINARELSIWNGVVSQAGGNPGGKEYLSFITKLNQQYAALGINDRIRRVGDDLVKISAKFQELERNAPGSSQALAAKLGIGPDLWLALKDGPAILQANIEKQRQFDNTTRASAEAAFELKQEWGNVMTTLRSSFTESIPIVRVLLDLFEGILKAVSAIGSFGNNVFGAILNPAFNLAERLGLISRTSQSSFAPVTTASSNQEESRAFWKSQGYSDAQISALLANEKAEGGFGSNAVGDGGQARGIAQWHSPRRARILAGTGIDVATASHAEQLRAQAWEMEQTGTADKLRGANSPAQGAAVLTAYEAPANAAYQAFARGQSANGFYAQMGRNAINGADGANIPAASNSKTITIGAITIHSQATDAGGIAADLGSALNRELGTTVQAFDDGIQR